MSSSKDCGMKFELDQKVLIKTMGNKEAIVTGWFCYLSKEVVSREYDVWYKDSNLGWESNYPSVMEYIGSAVMTRVKEEDLAPFTTLGVRGVDGAEWAEEKNHLYDSLRYALAGSSMLDKSLEKACEEYEKDMEHAFRVMFPNINKPNTVIAGPCPHSWKEYEGFTDSFDYCEKCNVKKTD